MPRTKSKTLELFYLITVVEKVEDGQDYPPDIIDQRATSPANLVKNIEQATIDSIGNNWQRKHDLIIMEIRSGEARVLTYAEMKETIRVSTIDSLTEEINAKQDEFNQVQQDLNKLRQQLSELQGEE